MKIIRNAAGIRGIKCSVVTLGNFDGIHAGHQRILKRLVKRAKAQGCPSVVYTFEPHPLKVVAPHKSPQIILDIADKEAIIGSFGVDYLVLARFTRSFAATHPRKFVEEVLVKGLRAKEVWVGAGFSFGKGRSGNVEYLKLLGKELGFKVSAVPPYKKGSQTVSSSRVRELIKSGDVKGAASLLGRSYSMKGKVSRGSARGVVLGFPTANLRITSELVPADGVYAAYAFVGKKRYDAVVNIGVAPTFGKRERAVEAHILGFNRDIYGKNIAVSFLKRLRDEKAFRGKEGLMRQIKKDIERASRYF